MTRALRMLTALVVAVTAVASAPPVEAAERYPTLTGTEFKDFYYARLPTLPGVAAITSRPPIYGHAGADDRIQRLAEARGYRLQGTPTTPLASYGGLTLAADAGRAWQALLAAARANGTPLQGNSGYRSVDTQRGIFIRQLRSAGYSRIGRPYTTSEIASGAADGAIDSVLAFHSIPGYSRHHTGKTIDLSHAGGTNGSFAGSAAHRWISADNYAVAKRFGLIPNYPPNAGPQGPNPEPWEYSYVGNEAIRCAIRYVALRDPDAPAICGSGVDDLAFIEDRNGTRIWHLRTPGQPETTIAYGTTADTPITGDWNGDNRTDLAFIENRNGTRIWHLRTPGQPETTIAYGTTADTPITGDWNGR